MFKTFEMELAGRPLIIETGKMAKQANGAVLVRYGDTAVLVATTASKEPREGTDFFPLTVDYEEKMYAVGKMPGGFLRREGRPGNSAILCARLIDRPIRPLFDKRCRNDIHVVATVLSVDYDNAPELCGMIGASASIGISDIPWDGPIAGVRVGRVDGKYVINPTQEEMAASTMNVTVAGSEEAIMMVEGGAQEAPEEEVLDAIMFGHETIKEICRFQKKIIEEVGKEKRVLTFPEVPAEIEKDVEAFATESLKKAIFDADKLRRDGNIAAAKKAAMEHFADIYPEHLSDVADALDHLTKEIVRHTITNEGIRPDGRKLTEIRPITCEVVLLPRVHGSALFTRGQTQVLTTCTLGGTKDNQLMDDLTDEQTKRYIHHYNFPPYSVGEARAPRSPGRREIGHGALAERALVPVLPSLEEFPYTIRCVSEVLSSNGSTSQASICGSTLALMDAGVPIKAPVAGISCGLITEGDRWMTMLDIQGVEDFHGDMDFKVGGTRKGITAIQMDIKIDGLTYDIIAEAFEKCRKGRLYILDEIIKPVIAEPRHELSRYAPKMFSMMIPTDKIKDVIGKGGKVIQDICATCNCKIDVQEDGHVFVSAVDQEDAKRAIFTIKTIVEDPEIGAIYKGKVTRLMNFGAFVEIAPGKEGLVHISKLDTKRVERVEDVVAVGDAIVVKVTDIDQQGRINLSRRDAILALEAKRAEQQAQQ